MIDRWNYGSYNIITYTVVQLSVNTLIIVQTMDTLTFIDTFPA